MLSNLTTKRRGGGSLYNFRGGGGFRKARTSGWENRHQEGPTFVGEEGEGEEERLPRSH